MKSRKDHIVPLSNQVIRLLDGLRKKSGDQEYLFVGDRTNKPISNNTLLRALERMGYKGKDDRARFQRVSFDRVT